MGTLRAALMVLLLAGFGHLAVPKSAAADGEPPMTGLLTAIVTWLSVNFALPADYDHPAVVRLPLEQLSSIRYKTVEAQRRREVLALYDGANRRILLSESWIGHSPAELSILVHEMVHHLQSVAAHSYACPAAREALAFAAQDRWLALFGSDLEKAFAIDPMTRKLATSCF